MDDLLVIRRLRDIAGGKAGLQAFDRKPGGERLTLRHGDVDETDDRSLPGEGLRQFGPDARRAARNEDDLARQIGVDRKGLRPGRS
ncbi:MAG: hypothetical protein QM711_12685 [Micropruina sp.]